MKRQGDKKQSTNHRKQKKKQHEPH
jgi:hypothetical protein